jgi:molybdopterin molybdotransferase
MDEQNRRQRRLISVTEAYTDVLTRAVEVSDVEHVALSEAAGRVTSDAIDSCIALPPFDRSAVDGYGLTFDDVNRQPMRALQVVGRVRAGPPQSSMQIGAGAAIWLATGAAVPIGVEGIVMEERCVLSDDGFLSACPTEQGTNIRLKGEDVPLGAILVSKGTVLDARHIAILAAVGYARVAVRRKVRVALLSTGDELMDGVQEPAPGMIYDSNRPMLAALLARPKINLQDAGLHGDDPHRLASVLMEVAKHVDLIITSRRSRR